MAEESTPASTEEKPADGSSQVAPQTAPADALSRNPEELVSEAAANPDTAATPAEPVKKPAGFKAVLKKVNIYLMGFLLVVAIVAFTGAVSFLNSNKQPKAPSVASQELTTEQLKQLANSDATVGAAAQTLTIQGNAIVSGQMLVRSSLDVAGGIKLGGELVVKDVTSSGKANLTTTQTNELQVAQTTILQGTTTTGDLNVGGTAAFGGPVTAGQLTVSRLIIAGNGTLQIPNHLSFTGPSPARSILDAGTMGAGGSVNVSGSDTTGTININTGSGPVAGCFAKINFALPFTNNPHIILSPFGAAAGKLNWYITKSKTGFSVCSHNAADPGEVFGFDYFITN